MPDPNPDQLFAEWFADHLGPSPAQQADLDEAQASDDPGAAFSAYLRAALAGSQPATEPDTESETL